ncbi:putative DNA-binding protein [Calidifontibacillus oryziterrae]|uniref:putative DNA-binding protein n=1 Tax=Calidifontibacillus oryziterrae TaxID=1191699 RepID=UPI0002FF5731|nr:putative DNA-binding protein [Calidifontibacillus oryziterrae]
MLEKTTRVNYLFDFYQSLLTSKQRNYMALYYLDDYSLGEIAEEYNVSRQAVYDNIKRTETMLEDYESKLRLFEKFQQKQEIIQQLKKHLHEYSLKRDDILELIETLEKLD